MLFISEKLCLHQQIMFASSSVLKSLTPNFHIGLLNTFGDGGTRLQPLFDLESEHSIIYMCLLTFVNFSASLRGNELHRGLSSHSRGYLCHSDSTLGFDFVCFFCFAASKGPCRRLCSLGLSLSEKADERLDYIRPSDPQPVYVCAPGEPH